MVYPHVHPLPPGKIYGSNLNLLLARLSELGIPETGGEHAGDDHRLWPKPWSGCWAAATR